MSWTPPHRLPYPEVFRAGEPFSSSWRKRRVCLQIAVLDWLVLGRPKAAPRYLRLGQKLSSEQWEIVKTLNGLSEDANSHLEVDASMMGRSAPKNDVTLRLYDDPDSNLVQDAANVVVPKVSVRATLDEKFSLYRKKMASCGTFEERSD